MKGHTLYRIEALRDFNDVKKGDLGGYVENEENLSHEDKCWVYDNAEIFGKARVYDNAEIRNDACVYDNAHVYGDAIISNKACVYGNAHVYGDAKVYGIVEIRNDACVYGNAHVYGDAKVYGNSNIYESARVFDNAEVCGESTICGRVSLYGNKLLITDAYITDNNDYINIGPIGSRDAYTTFYLNKDKKIIVNCGCFNDTIEEFIKAVNRTHKDNKKYRSQYIGAITYAKCVLYNESIL